VARPAEATPPPVSRDLPAGLELVIGRLGDARAAKPVYPVAGAPLPGRSDRLVQGDVPLDRRGIIADQDLMAAVAEGDGQAFGRLVAAETPRLVRFARTLLTASPAEAEEVVQEALLRLWKLAPDWQPNARVGTWLHQVVYRLCIDTIRRRRPSVEIGTLESEIEDDGPLPDARLIRDDEVTMVQAAIALLPERQRTALTLCHFQELGQAEASAVMGIGESAYESLLARARRRLRKLLDPDENGEEG
jgi:RNA polymerase sigma-70 factor (ECF subfamily)